MSTRSTPNPLYGEVRRDVSGGAVSWDLRPEERAHRRSVYEEVLREGTVEDVTGYIRLSDLVESLGGALPA
ncbi:MAG: hypothetical protein M3O70_12765 [Actinomycetota bacterium]|nr:hypothetical protein [Actinomycetota bacterium]